MGEFRTHRVRFFNYEPSPINCLSYSDSVRKLAISRADGTIEIWNSDNDWYQEMVLPPIEDAVSEVIAWCGGRLFSAGLHAKVFEHDLTTGAIKNTAFSNSGAIWCLAANSRYTTLAAGTEDGCVVLFSMTSDGIVYDRQLDKQESRIMCLAWHEPNDVIVTGGIDNIRVWSLKSGHAIQRLTLGRTERNKETLVWTLCVTSDFVIVSGDSQGRVCFWNGRHGTLVKSFRSHQADVLSLCITSDGSSVFASGVDPVLVQFELVPVTEGGEWKNWVRSNVRSRHSHDVRCVTLAGDWVASGGVDCRLVLNKLDKKRGLVFSRKLPPFPMDASLVSYANEANQVLLRYSTYVELWKLGTTSSEPGKDDEILPLQSTPVKMLQLKSHGSQVIYSCAVSPKANWLAYSSTSGLRLFSMGQDSPDGQVTVSRIKSLPPTVLLPSCLQFSPDGTTLVIGGYSGRVQCLTLANGDVPRVDWLSHHTSDDNNDTKQQPSVRSIHLMTFSSSGKYLATADLERNICIYNLRKNKLVSTLLKYSRLPTALSFSPSSREILVAYSDLKMFEFVVKSGEMTAWSRQHNSVLQHSRGHPLFHKVVWLQYDAERPDKLLVADHQTLCIIDKLPATSEDMEVNTSSSSSSNKKIDPVHVCNKFRYIMHAELAANNYLVVVERPPVSLMECLPATLKKKKFGT